MTEERKQEILNIIKTTNRRHASAAPSYPEDICEYLERCEAIRSITRTVDGFSYRMDILNAKNRSADCPVFINIHGG